MFDLVVAAPAIGAVIAGGAIFAIARRHLGVRNAVLAAVVAGLTFGVAWFLMFLFAVFAAILAAVVYALALRRAAPGRALVIALGSYVVIVAGLGGLSYAALAYTA
ncbi:hypothetical protein BCF44_10414 [Kutzneria buriramensis]|uniref:Uncharacterized protein n=1 Tax=Kutzneria buriramensis TaxID=1045776 RepID=A0A3E0HTN3_9PSEU|nr:hypothetical protein BCF44_10414 [Kutzneria buriramensis]